jgi:hypothetical protein
MGELQDENYQQLRSVHRREYMSHLDVLKKVYFFKGVSSFQATRESFLSHLDMLKMWVSKVVSRFSSQYQLSL